MRKSRLVHGAIALAIAVAVPAAVWWINDVFPLEAAVLGLTLGICYWIWGVALFL